TRARRGARGEIDLEALTRRVPLALGLLLFVLGSPVASTIGFRLAHVGSALRLAVVLVARIVINATGQVHPNDDIRAATLLGIGLGSKLVGWCGNGGLSSDGSLLRWWRLLKLSRHVLALRQKERRQGAWGIS